MTRKTITLMLDRNSSTPPNPAEVQATLTNVPGVIHATVNSATEAAYIEYDADRCGVDQLVSAVPASAQHVGHTSKRVQPDTVKKGQITMQRTSTRPAVWIALAAAAALAAYFILSSSQARIWNVLPLAFILACPFLHFFGHGRHGGHRGQRDGSDG